MEQLSQTDLALPSFYVAIEAAADTIPDFSEKQKFLNTVYEQFFQRFAVERADTLGIVYTPQEIVHREHTSSPRWQITGCLVGAHWCHLKS